MLVLELTSKALDPETQLPLYHETVEDIVKNITIDDNLTTNLESSSSLWKITLPHDCPYSLGIIEQDELKAVLKDVDKEHPEIIYQTFFTGWVSNSFNYTIDQYGQRAVQITLEDNGTHLLKVPYTKDESEVIEGKFSSTATGDLGVVQKICEKCGITYVSNIITDSTEVKAVAEAAETCESLLKSLCKEMRHAYSFNELGQLYLVPLSTDSIPAEPPLYDNSLYDSINLVKRARTYRGSRIKWTELGTKRALVYQDPNGQTTIYPNCHISISNGTYYPLNSSADSLAHITADDIKNGSEIFSVDTLYTDVVLDPVNCATYTIDRYGVTELEVRITGLASGYINKLEAEADITYIKNHNVTYGNAKEDTESSITDNLHEEECRWIHDNSDSNNNPVTKYANFIAQYDRYSSREFTFKTKNTYSLGQIIHLNENLHTTLDNYLMVTRRTRTLTSYDETNRQFSGMWTYVAVSTREFNYIKTVTEESTSIPPTSSYTQVLPDMEDYSGIQLSTDLSFLKKDLRSSATQTMNIYASVIGEFTGITVTASYSNGDAITVTPDPQVDNKWSITVPENMNVQGVNITAWVGTDPMNTIYVSYNDLTQYYKFLGPWPPDEPGQWPARPTEAKVGTILPNDFYIDKTDGKTYECTSRTETQSDPIFTWDVMPLNADNANKFLISLEGAVQAGVNLESMNNPNTVSWFNTIIAAKAVIDSLFSRYITILSGGSIHSDYYNGDGTVNTSSTATRGFYLGGDTGELKCYSGDFVNTHSTNMVIDGNSEFNGDFDCEVIKTSYGASTPVQFDTQYNDYRQAHWLSIALQNYGLQRGQQSPGPRYSCSISGVSGIAYIAIREGQSDPLSTSSFATELYFYNSDKNQVDITQYLSCDSAYTSGTTLRSVTVNGRNEGVWATNGFTLYINTADQLLEINVPDFNERATLSNNNLYTSSSWLRVGRSGTVSVVTGTPSMNYDIILPPGLVFQKVPSTV